MRAALDPHPVLDRAEIEGCEEADASGMTAKLEFVSIDRLEHYIGKKVCTQSILRLQSSVLDKRPLLALQHQPKLKDAFIDRLEHYIGKKVCIWRQHGLRLTST